MISVTGPLTCLLHGGRIYSGFILSVMVLSPLLAMTDVAMDTRARLAESGIQIVTAPDAGLHAPDVQQIEAGWLRSGELPLAIDFTGHPGSIKVLKQYGQIKSTGKDMLLLSTGLADATLARPGSDLRAGDGVTLPTELKLLFEPPMGTRQLSFRYQFMTAEFPEFTEKGFDDVLSVRVIDALGEREVLRESSASPDLYPVAASLTSGSPMDLYSQVPGQLTGDFRLGRPAAGTTGWRLGSFEIAQSGPVEVIFSMQDGADGLVDSTVLIENVDMRAMQFALPDRTTMANLRGSADGALQCIQQGGVVQGAVADGVTAVIFRVIVTGPGSTVYSFTGGNQAPQDGGYDELGGSQRLSTISVRSMFDGNDWISEAQYLVPEEFNRGGDEGLGNRFVNLRVDFFPDDPKDTPFGGTLPFNLLRPAVILMHGLWSNKKTWNGSPLLSDPRLSGLVHKGDYEDTHAAYFSVNMSQPAKPIREACQALRSSGIATTQFDYIGHSMGGNIGRIFFNQQPGLANKFFTINTPHTGSPLANLAVSFRDNVLPQLPFGLEQKVLDWLKTIEHAIDQGALDDLSIGSPAMNSIAATMVPSHALVGIGGSDYVGDVLAQSPDPFLGVLFKILNFLDDTTDLFVGIQHDFVVGRSSQEGGIAASASTIFDGFDSTHNEAPSSPAYASRIVGLLNTPAISSSFGAFPPPSSLAIETSEQVSEQFRETPSLAFSGSSDIELILPGGASAAPGDLLAVAVSGLNGFDPQRALVMSRLDAVELQVPDLSGIIELPDDFIGTLELSVLGVDDNGVYTILDAPVTVNVVTDSTLTGMSIFNDDILLFEQDDFRQLSVFGTFSDGVERDITDPVTGTHYASADAGIALVSADGRVIGLTPGITTLSATNAGLQDSISVEVVNGQVILRDGFE